MSIENHPNLHSVNLCRFIAVRYFKYGTLNGRKTEIYDCLMECLRGRATKENIPDFSKSIDSLIELSENIQDEEHFRECLLDWLLGVENLIDFVVEDFAGC
jgi:hypothetical protein